MARTKIFLGFCLCTPVQEQPRPFKPAAPRSNCSVLRCFPRDLASKALWSLGNLLVRGSNGHAFDLASHLCGRSAPAPGVRAPAARCARRFLSARPAAPPCAWARRRQPRYRCLGCSSLLSARHCPSRPRVPCSAFSCGRPLAAPNAGRRPPGGDRLAPGR